MKILLNLEDNIAAELESLSKSMGVSRMFSIKEAVSEYISKHKSKNKDAAFGLWKDRKIDGLSYQRKLRDEW